MTKSLRSFPEEERKRVAQRRAASASGGLGYLAALDFLARKKAETHTTLVEEVKKKEETNA